MTNFAHSVSCHTHAVRSFRALSIKLWPKRGLWVSQGVKEITLIGQNVNAYLGRAPKIEGDGEWGPRSTDPSSRDNGRLGAITFYDVPSTRYG